MKPEIILQLEKELNIDFKDIENIPIEIIKQGKEAVKIWFSKKEKMPVNETKVIFVGEGAVGKTSVMKQLMNLQFN